MKTHEPFEPFTRAASTLREYLLAGLLRECLPYLNATELSPSTSPILRGLISDIEHTTKVKA